MLKITFKKEQEAFNIRFEENTEQAEIQFNKEFITRSSVPVYKGEYEITPDIEPQTLETKEKRLEKDITIDAIPHYTVSNKTGNTFIIGKGDLII